jgi:DNA polymerase
MLDRTSSPSTNQRRPKRVPQAAADLIDFDIETRSELDLKKVGVFKYAIHPSTEVLCVAFSVDGGPTQLWRQGDPTPLAFRKPPKKARAHNAHFEHLITKHVLHRLYPDWAVIPIENFTCTMVAGLSVGLPASLAKAADALELKNRKDASGHRLMLSMTKPKKPRGDQK